MRLLAMAGVACIVLAGAWLVVAVEPPGPMTLIAVGDIMLSRNVAKRMMTAGDPLLPFRNVSAFLDSSDLNFGNLECPFAPPQQSASGTQSAWDGIIGGKSLVFGAPNKAVEGLKRFNFQVVAMANNHAMDQGEAGLGHTLDRLAANGIRAAGAGRNLEEAWQARIVERKGRRVAFLAVSYASLNYGTDERNEYVARIEDLDRLSSRVDALKSQVDCIVVAMHAGAEYTGAPGPAQIAFAHAAIDAGADIVIGSHPHWLQPVEHYRGGLIFYSLGNFIFDLDSSPATREGAAVKLFIGRKGVVKAEVYPIEIENSCCARPARPDEIPGVLRRMQLSSPDIPVERKIGRSARDPAGSGPVRAIAP